MFKIRMPFNRGNNYKWGFEVKDYNGWIFGSGYNSQWTQVLAYGNSRYRFYNPIMQNSKHISDLKKQLRQFETIPFYSIIVFMVIVY